MDRDKWYIEHRIEYLQNQQRVLKKQLTPGVPFDYVALEKFMENKGALRELRRLLGRLDRM